MTGFIVLDKPEGITSFKANAIVRSTLRVKKTGHTGTLDPMATGVLPVAIGSSARFIDLLPNHEKSYIASFRLGETTDTLDITGTTLTTSDNIPGFDETVGIFADFTGEITQLPPMYSAIKKDGVRLYELARQGIEIEREARSVTIKKLELVSFSSDEYTISVDCSQGTYIRSLISDIGDKLGCGAVMTRLRRTFSNGFSIEDAHTPEQLKAAAADGMLSSLIIPTDRVLSDYPAVTVSEAQAKRFKNGGELDTDRLKVALTHGYYRVYAPSGTFLGLGELRQDETFLRIKRILNDA